MLRAVHCSREIAVTYTAIGSPTTTLTDAELGSHLETALHRLGPRRKVIAVPPDMSRLHSRAGRITGMAWRHYGDALRAVLPAIGTHFPMSDRELEEMYPGVPRELFRVHNWQADLATLGRVPGAVVREVSEGRLDFDWPAQLNSALVDDGYDLILSIGQVVPHEVTGMANYNKNIFIGTGGREGIHKSHYLGAVCDMERIMGRIDTPVRRVLNYASERFAADLPIVYILTVIGRDDTGELVLRGLFIGDNEDCFRKAARLSRQVNVTTVAEPLDTVVVYLDPAEYRSTWIGNKAVYRSRMALADGGRLIVLAPGVHTFGEDGEIDAHIRAHGYRGTDYVTELVKGELEGVAGAGGLGLADNLAAAAHLIHGSSEGRFSITYCAGGLTQEEIEGVGYDYADVSAMSKRYLPANRRIGMHTTDDGETYYFIANPGLGLWGTAERLGGH
ncbi:MAG: D-mannonate epimerase [bacterium]